MHASTHAHSCHTTEVVNVICAARDSLRHRQLHSRLTSLISHSPLDNFATRMGRKTGTGLVVSSSFWFCKERSDCLDSGCADLLRCVIMHQQPLSHMAAPHDDAELEKILQSLTQIAGGKQDRKPKQDAGQEVIPTKGYVKRTEICCVLRARQNSNPFCCTTGSWSRLLISKGRRCL